ncbi:condensation domain-containing protein, partial [Streptomyces sp. NPDC127574]|uniref:condensation domain-containing protein n=1 Tax=Streptomyces sp. NPDC127574 TaxID=3345401 RepID=UPI00364076FC
IDQLDIWPPALDGIPDQLELPFDRPRPKVADYRGDTVPIRIDAELHRALHSLAQETNTTLFMVLQAALATLLSRLGAGSDIPLGTPVAGRTDEALDDLVGFFVNTWVLRADLSTAPTFTDLLEQVREKALAAYDNQDIPFERLVELLGQDRATSYQPLFQTMLAWQFVWPRIHLPGLDATPLAADTKAAKFDLFFNMIPDSSGGAGVRLEYATDLFDQDTVQAIAARFVR